MIMANKFDLIMFDWNGTLSSGLIAAGQISSSPVSELFDGVPEALKTLHDQGKFLGIATAASNREIQFELEVHDIAKYFTVVMTADHGPLKPHPFALLEAMKETGTEPGQTCMIGDTNRDMLLAKNAGVTAIGVTYGLRSGDDLIASGADYTIDNLGELL